MKRGIVERFTMGVLAAVLTVSVTISTLADEPRKYINGGRFTDWDSLTWEANDGTVTTYGRGPIFNDVHPEITDSEYYLKEAAIYPGEDEFAVNSQGDLKANYPEQSVNAIREFLNSFDWIHSDEVTRAERIYERIALGYHGNDYGFGDSKVNFTVLETGKGICGNFAREYTMLANFVGLECVKYQPSAYHEACLLKLNGQWFAVDPTSGTPIYSNNTTYPVDYETEFHRWEKEENARWEAYCIENPDNWAVRIDKMNKQLAAGIITEEQYDKMYDDLMNNK